MSSMMGGQRPADSTEALAGEASLKLAKKS